MTIKWHISKRGFWIRINGYGLSFSTWDSFSERNGYNGVINKYMHRNLGFHINTLKPLK